jgi:hypothetical protein
VLYICLLVGIHFKGLTNHNMLERGAEDEVPNVASACMQFEKIRELFLIPCLLMGGSLRVACPRSSKEAGQVVWSPTIPYSSTTVVPCLG